MTTTTKPKPTKKNNTHIQKKTNKLTDKQRTNKKTKNKAKQ